MSKVEKMDSDNFCMSFTFQNPLKLTLRTPIELQNHEVALRFISLPESFYNMPETWVEVRTDADKNKVVIPAGFYESLSQLVEKIVEMISNENILLQLDKIRNIVRASVSGPRTSLQFSPVLASILRLPTGTIKQGIDMHSASRVTFSGRAQVFFLTSNFTSAQISNDKMMNFLGTISTTSSDTNQLPNLYFPVRAGPLQHIEINIVSSSGQPVLFLSGSITVVLHFRKKQ